MVAAVTAHYLISSCIHSGYFNCILVGIGSALVKILSHVVRHQLNDLLSQLRAAFRCVTER